jgi:hypothetical protein
MNDTVFTIPVVEPLVIPLVRTTLEKRVEELETTVPVL